MEGLTRTFNNFRAISPCNCYVVDTSALRLSAVRNRLLNYRICALARRVPVVGTFGDGFGAAFFRGDLLERALDLVINQCYSIIVGLVDALARLIRVDLHVKTARFYNRRRCINVASGGMILTILYLRIATAVLLANVTSVNVTGKDVLLRDVTNVFAPIVGANNGINQANSSFPCRVGSEDQATRIADKGHFRGVEVCHRYTPSLTVKDDVGLTRARRRLPAIKIVVPIVVLDDNGFRHGGNFLISVANVYALRDFVISFFNRFYEEDQPWVLRLQCRAVFS